MRVSGKERKGGVFLATWPSCAHAFGLSVERELRAGSVLGKRNLPLLTYPL